MGDRIERAAAVAAASAVVLGAGVLVAIVLDVRSRRPQPARATERNPFPHSTIRSVP